MSGPPRPHRAHHVPCAWARVRLPLGPKGRLRGRETFYPNPRILASLDGAKAVPGEGFHRAGLMLKFDVCRDPGSHEVPVAPLVGSASRSSPVRVLQETGDPLSGTFCLRGESTSWCMDFVEVACATENPGTPKGDTNAIREQMPEHFESTLWDQSSRWKAYTYARLTTCSTL